ncbi:hypothetical protein ACQEVY_00290 [Streptomyces sp. CA-288835]|uniref:hypothetical protein n=1 Tax=Streptomyces sp. CA-288835 TaxID=3240069 RepID=UPI003D8E6D46
MPTSQLREHRLLHEAEAHGDHRRICGLFGLSVGAAHQSSPPACRSIQVCSAFRSWYT